MFKMKRDTQNFCIKKKKDELQISKHKNYSKKFLLTEDKQPPKLQIAEMEI